MFNPGIFTVLKQNEERRKAKSNSLNSNVPEDLDDPIHAKWQTLCREGQVVESIKEARTLGLDLPSAHALVNQFRKREGLMPPRPRRWWWPFS